MRNGFARYKTSCIKDTVQLSMDPDVESYKLGAIQMLIEDSNNFNKDFKKIPEKKSPVKENVNRENKNAKTVLQNTNNAEKVENHIETKTSVIKSGITSTFYVSNRNFLSLNFSELDDWNPMKEHYEASTNVYEYNDENLDYVFDGYSKIKIYIFI